MIIHIDRQKDKNGIYFEMFLNALVSKNCWIKQSNKMNEWQDDIQHNDTRQNGIQQNDTQHNDIQYNNTQNNDIQHKHSA